MVNSCATSDCTNRQVKGSGMKFHRFPLQNKELCAKWIAAMKHDKSIPTENSCVKITMLTPLNLKITLCHLFLN